MLGPGIVVLFMVMSIGADDAEDVNYVTATQVSRRHVNTASGADGWSAKMQIYTLLFPEKHLCITSIKHYHSVPLPLTPSPP